MCVPQAYSPFWDKWHVCLGSMVVCESINISLPLSFLESAFVFLSDFEPVKIMIILKKMKSGMLHSV